jgi:hypothetical protein
MVWRVCDSRSVCLWFILWCALRCGFRAACHLRQTVMLYMLDNLLRWTAHLEHQEVWAVVSWSSFDLKVH